MKRNAIQELVAWKSSEDRKPMVLKGARQVGKTWLMKEFGQNYYDSYVYFNFDEEDELKSIFEVNKNPHHRTAVPDHRGENSSGKNTDYFRRDSGVPGSTKYFEIFQGKGQRIPCDRRGQFAGNPPGAAQVLSRGHGQSAGHLSADF